MKLKHRVELWLLGLIEMWERFGFYILIDVMVYLLCERMHFSKERAALLYGEWNAAVYMAPLLGGYLADRHLGYRKSVLAGVITLAVGYLLLGGCFHFQHLAGVYLSMGLIVLGNGLFKPNMSAMIGNLYPAGDPRTDSAFSIFYQFVNGGALLSPLAAATIRHYYSSSMTIIVAGFGLLLGVAGTLRNWGAFASLDRASSLAAVTGVALPPEYDDAPEPPSIAREKVRAIVIFSAIIVAFWIAFHQNGSTLSFWAAENTDLTLGGFLAAHPTLNQALETVGWATKGKVDPVLFQTINSLCIILFTRPVLALFDALERAGHPVSTPAKVGVGMVLTGVTYAIMAAAGLAGGNHGKVSALWLVGSYGVISAAELMLSPMGLAMVSKLSPRHLVGSMLGVWYVAVALGNYLCGAVGRYWTQWEHHSFFLLLVGISLAPLGLLAWQYPRLLAVMPKPRVAPPVPAPSPRALGLTLETEAC